MKRLIRDRLVTLSRTTPGFRGKTRIARALEAVLGQQAIPPIERLGANFIIEGRDIIEFNLLWHGAYGPEIVACLDREIREQGRTCLWDIGANIGTVSLPLAGRYPNLDVHAFEPSPRAQFKLGANRRANPTITNIHAYALALSNDAGLVPFYESFTEHSSGISTMYVADANRDTQKVLVQSVRGDTLIEEGIAPRPDLIKIDIEGWEKEALEGLSGLIADGGPLSILWEHTLYRIVERGHPKTVITDLLEDGGFELWACKPGSDDLVPFNERMLDHDHDFLARR